MIGISKSFGGVRALNSVDFGVRYGEIHALLGENGAGKSTLLRMLLGVHPPDAGEVEIAGTRRTSRAVGGRDARIAMIFQEMNLIPTLTVAQNVFFNREIRDRFGMIDDHACSRETARMFEEFGVPVDPETQVSELSAGRRQLTEIVKAMSRAARILVLDEPTSALTASEVDHLFAVLRRLRDEGAAIVYVSHRMDEIFRIADCATIMRDGQRVITAPLSELTLERVIEWIVGRRAQGLTAGLRGASAEIGSPLLKLRGASGPAKPRAVDLTIRAGEIVGVVGLLGSGRSSLARMIFGIEPLVEGEMRVRGRKVDVRSSAEAIAAGIALIPEDRVRQGLVLQHSVSSNVLLSILDKISRGPWIALAEGAKIVNAQVASLNVKTSSVDAAVSSLSGGNQQKVVVGKWLATEPDILLLDEPTAGIDIGSKAEILELVRDLARRQKAILLISSEVNELLAVCDRVIIVADGRIAGEISREGLGLDGADEDHLDGGDRLLSAERRLQVEVQRASRA